MKLFLITVWFALFTGCTAVNRTSLITSTATIAVDWFQTRCSAGNGWPDNTWEENPILGKKPGTLSVDAYMTAAVITNIAIWYLMPSKYKSIIPTAVTAAQTHTIISNYQWRRGGCPI